MGTLLHFHSPQQRRPAKRELADATGDIVIFPGVRIERHDLDLGHRLLDTLGRPTYEDTARSTQRSPRTS